MSVRARVACQEPVPFTDTVHAFFNTSTASGGSTRHKLTGCPCDATASVPGRPSVAHVGSSEHRAVRVQNFAIRALPTARRCDSPARGTGVKLQQNTRKLASDPARQRSETDHARFGVAEIDPLKAANSRRPLRTARVPAIQAVQFPHHGLQLVVTRKLQQTTTAGRRRDSIPRSGRIRVPMNSSFLPGCANM